MICRNALRIHGRGSTLPSLPLSPKLQGLLLPEPSVFLLLQHATHSVTSRLGPQTLSPHISANCLARWTKRSGTSAELGDLPSLQRGLSLEKPMLSWNVSKSVLRLTQTGTNPPPEHSPSVKTGVLASVLLRDTHHTMYLSPKLTRAGIPRISQLTPQLQESPAPASNPHLHSPAATGMPHSPLPP